MSPAPKAPDARHDAAVIGTVGFAHGVSHFFHLVIPTLFPWLMRDFSLNFTQAGTLMTVFFVVSGFGQAAAGFFVDRLGARRVLMGGVTLLAMSAVLLAQANGYWMLAFAAVVAGLGNSIFHPADFTLLNKRVSESRLGHAFSVHGLSGNLGWGATPLLLTASAGLWGWRMAALVAAACAVLALVILQWQREAVATEVVHAKDPASPAHGTFAFLQLPAVWLCFAFFLVVTLAFGALQNYAPAAFQQLFDMGLAVASSVLSAFMLGSAGGMVVGGWLAKRAAAERVIAGALLLTSAGACTLAAGAVVAGFALPLMAAMGFSNGLAGPSRDLLIRRAATARLGAGSLGRTYGFVYSGLDAGLALAPLVFGRLMDGGHPQGLLAGVAVLQLLAVGIAVAVAGMSAKSAQAGPA